MADILLRLFSLFAQHLSRCLLPFWHLATKPMRPTIGTRWRRMHGVRWCATLNSAAEVGGSNESEAEPGGWVCSCSSAQFHHAGIAVRLGDDQAITAAWRSFCLICLYVWLYFLFVFYKYFFNMRSNLERSVLHRLNMRHFLRYMESQNVSAISCRRTRCHWLLPYVGTLKRHHKHLWKRVMH